MRRLELPSVRALEDMLITDCFYAGLLKGKLDQRNRWGRWWWRRSVSGVGGLGGWHAPSLAMGGHVWMVQGQRLGGRALGTT